jgi:hypothetical protein
MVAQNLEKLNNVVKVLIRQDLFTKAIGQLNKDISHCHEPFVWSVVDIDSIGSELPDEIRSCWIFVLKKDVPSGCHYHPNSIQHMVAIKGRGTSKVGGTYKRIIKFGSPRVSLAETWYIIDKGVPHEFFPVEENLIVVSFHTCEANELEEIACGSGEKRLYEGETIALAEIL